MARRRHKSSKTIFYTRTKRSANRKASSLRRAGCGATVRKGLSKGQKTRHPRAKYKVVKGSCHRPS